MAKAIEFKGTDGLEYKFETRVRADQIQNRTSWEDMPMEEYQRLVKLGELFPYYQEFTALADKGQELPAITQAKFVEFSNLLVKQLVEDFIKAYPEHLIASEYHPLKGAPYECQVMFGRLIGPMKNLAFILAQVFSDEENVSEVRKKLDEVMPTARRKKTSV